MSQPMKPVQFTDEEYAVVQELLIKNIPAIKEELANEPNFKTSKEIAKKLLSALSAFEKMLDAI